MRWEHDQYYDILDASLGLLGFKSKSCVSVAAYGHLEHKSLQRHTQP